MDYCASIIVNLCLLKSSYSKVFHIYNNNSINFLNMINIIRNNTEKPTIISDKEFYDYIKNKTNILGIINDVTSTDDLYNSHITLKNDFTLNYMKNLDLTWPIIDKDYLDRFFKQFLI